MAEGNQSQSHESERGSHVDIISAYVCFEPPVYELEIVFVDFLRAAELQRGPVRNKRVRKRKAL